MLGFPAMFSSSVPGAVKFPDDNGQTLKRSRTRRLCARAECRQDHDETLPAHDEPSSRWNAVTGSRAMLENLALGVGHVRTLASSSPETPRLGVHLGR